MVCPCGTGSRTSGIGFREGLYICSYRAYLCLFARMCAIMRGSNDRCPSTLRDRYDHISTNQSLPTRQKIVPKRDHATSLNLKDFSDDTRPSSRQTRVPLLQIFSVIGRNNILTSLGMVHHGLGMREKSIEAIVEDTSGDEGINIADVEANKVEMLAWF